MTKKSKALQVSLTSLYVQLEVIIHRLETLYGADNPCGVQLEHVQQEIRKLAEQPPKDMRVWKIRLIRLRYWLFRKHNLSVEAQEDGTRVTTIRSIGKERVYFGLHNAPTQGLDNQVRGAIVIPSSLEKSRP